MNSKKQCEERLEAKEAERKTAGEAKQIDTEHHAEEAGIAKKRKKIIAITVPIIAACIAFVILLITVILPYARYNAAMKLLNAGKYEAAHEAFVAMGGYKDSANMAVESIYQMALAETAAGEYVEAYETLIGLNEYKDSAAKAEEIYAKYEIAIIKAAQVGDYVVFGSYEQDNNTSNGKEAVEWLVLAKENSKALVISRHALDSKPYNAAYTDVTWESCTLRRWLNGTFFNCAFNADEQKKIADSMVTADKNPHSSTNPGSNTTDKMFLLSIPEVSKYFSSNGTIQCMATVYAEAQGAHAFSDYVNCMWWLRSPGFSSSGAAHVNVGGINYAGRSVNVDYVAIRPAMWLNLD